MDEKEINNKLLEIIWETTNTPKDQQKNGNDVKQSLTDIHTCIKYLMFDLEATKRERDNLRKILDQLQQDDDNDDSDTIGGEM
jgi:hypothetical protein